MKSASTKRGGPSRLRLWAITAAVTALLAFPLVARASDWEVSVVDVIDPTDSVEIAQGGSAPIVINVSVTGKQDGTATFKVYKTWTLTGGTFVGSNPEELTVGPQDGGTTTNLDPIAATVVVGAGEATGSYTLTVGVFDIENSNTTAAKLDKGTSGEYEVVVVAGSSNTAPTIAWATLGNPSTADEGQTKTYNFEITDPDADTWTFAAGYPTCGTDGTLVASSESINSTTKTGTFQCLFPDGPASPTVAVKVNDGTVDSNELTQAVTVSNVAPTIGTITPASGALYAVNTAFTLSIPFSDPAGVNDTYTCTIVWDDGTTNSVTNPATSPCGGSKTYTAAGVYSIGITVSDEDGGSDSETIMIIVYDPSAGFVTGGGWINSPAGAYLADTSLSGKATFGFVSKYQKGKTVPTGNTQFQLHFADLNFHSISYEWLVVAGTSKAQYKGVGTINGEGTYGFLLTAYDGGNTGDKFRIKIWDISTGDTVYDNKIGESDDVDSADPQEIGGGSIVIHVPKK